MNPQDREFFYSLAMSIMTSQVIILDLLPVISRPYSPPNAFAIEENVEELEYHVE